MFNYNEYYLRFSPVIFIKQFWMGIYNLFIGFPRNECDND